MKRTIILTIGLLLFFNVFSQTEMKCPWGLEWGISKRTLQDMLIAKHKNYTFNSYSNNNNIYDVEFAGYYWTYVSFVFNKDRLCCIEFFKSYESEKGCLSTFNHLIENLSDKYPIERDERDEYEYYYVGNNGYVNISKDYSPNGNGDYKHWISLHYSDSNLSLDLYKSQKEEL